VRLESSTGRQVKSTAGTGSKSEVKSRKRTELYSSFGLRASEGGGKNQKDTSCVGEEGTGLPSHQKNYHLSQEERKANIAVWRLLSLEMNKKDLWNEKKRRAKPLAYYGREKGTRRALSARQREKNQNTVDRRENNTLTFNFRSENAGSG